jgi:Mycothiol maleylpyruvate isomerase N-terminal domain
LGQALQGALAILTRVRPEDLDGPTPCASWDVRAVVNHFVGTAGWLAATISGDGGVSKRTTRPGFRGRV